MSIKEEIKKRAKEAGFIAKETVKGLPKAGEKVGKILGKKLGSAMQYPFKIARKGAKSVMDEEIKFRQKIYSPKTKEEKAKRAKELDRIKELERKYK